MLNPITRREVKTRFRTGRSALTVSAWLLFVGASGYLIFRIAQSFAADRFRFSGGSSVLASSLMGSMMFELLSLMLLSAVLLVVPTVAALAVVGERERLTLELLQVSQLKARQVVMGKLASSLAYLLLLVVAVAPILTLPLLIGGVTLADVAAAIGMISAAAIMVGAVSIWISSAVKTSRAAVALSLLFVGLITVGSLLAMVGELFAFQADDGQFFARSGREVVSVWPNPYFGMVSAVDEPIRSLDAGGTPFSAAHELLIRRQAGDVGFFGGFVDQGFDGPFIEGGFDEFGQPIQAAIRQRRGPVWVRTLALYTAVTGVALWAATRRVTVPRRRV